MPRWPKQLARAGVDQYGRTPLWYAAADGHIDRLHAALNTSDDPSIGDDVGCTPLHVAVQNGHMAVVQALVKAGAALNSPDKHGNAPLWTAVHQACLALRTEVNLGIVRLLLESGANADLRNVYGRTPREMACVRDPVIAALFVANLHLP